MKIPVRMMEQCYLRVYFLKEMTIKNKKKSLDIIRINQDNDEDLSIKLTALNGEKENLYSYFLSTNQVDVLVKVEFIDHNQKTFDNISFWAYHIIIKNNSDEALTLRHRHWKIIDSSGNLQEVDGEGVVGKQPRIEPSASFRYSSGVHLFTNSGIMSGNYLMQKDSGKLIEVAIPTFSLDDPNHSKIIN